MKRRRYKKKEPELVRLPGCEGCTKNCIWNGKVATERVAKNKNVKYGCNNLEFEINLTGDK